MLSPTNRLSGPDKWVQAGAVLFALFFLITSFYISGHRLFWYDEVFTTMTTRLPDWTTVWRALVHDNYDPMPIGYFALARLSDGWFGPGEIGIRLPSMLAVFAGLLLTYDSARRLSNPLHGFLAMAILSCSLLPYYGYEGRSYGLYFFVAALALWTWITERPAVVFGAVILAGVLIHYYVVLCLVPFVAHELYSWRPGYRPRPQIFAGAIGAAIAIAILAPQILASRKNYGQSFWASPSFAKMPQVITELFPAGLVLLAAGMFWILLMDRRKAVNALPMGGAERACWFFLLIPLVAFVLAKTVTNAYTSRYLIGVLPGVAVGMATLLWRRFHEVPRVSAGILAMLVLYGGFLQLNATRKADLIQAFGPAQERTRKMLRMENQIWADGRRYIVIPEEDLLFLEARYYSRHPERYVLFADRPITPAKYYPMPIWKAEDVKQHFREAAFLNPRFELANMMIAAGAHVVLKYPGMLPVFYIE